MHSNNKTGQHEKGSTLWNSYKFNTVHDTYTHNYVSIEETYRHSALCMTQLRSRYISLLAVNIFRINFENETTQQRQLNYVSKHISQKQSSYFQRYLPEIITFVMNFLPSRKWNDFSWCCAFHDLRTHASNIAILSLTEHEFSRSLCSFVSLNAAHVQWCDFTPIKFFFKVIFFSLHEQQKKRDARLICKQWCRLVFHLKKMLLSIFLL